jgi:hypothetical protein
MSRQNKVNTNNYTQRGRLTPDEFAREEMHQTQISSAMKAKERVVGKRQARKSGEGDTSRPRSAPEE